MILLLPYEIISYICDFINDSEKIILLSLNKELNNCKNLTFYRNAVNYETIANLWYFDNFINVIINNLTILPKFITHLTFGREFNQSIQNAIPASVTHLEIPIRYNSQLQNSKIKIKYLKYLK